MRPNFLNTEVVLTTTLLPINSASTTDHNCTGIDGQGYGSVVHCVHLGDSADTLSGSVKLELEVEESDDNSTYTDCADSALVNPTTGGTGTVTGTNTGTFALIDAPAEDSTIYSVRYVGTKRYSRVVINKTGTHTTGIPLSAFALRALPVIAT